MRSIRVSDSPIPSDPSSFRRAGRHDRLNRLLAHVFPLFWSIVPPAALRLLPGTSRRFGPPRRTARWSELRRHPGTRWRAVFEPSTQFLPPPFFCSSHPPATANRFAVAWPEAGVAEIPRARLLDEHTWPVAPRDTFIADFACNGLSRQCHVRRTLKLHSLQHLPGRTLNLCSAHAATNFFHFLADALSRVALVRRAGYSWDDFDRILLPRFDSAMARDLIAAIGFPTHKIMRVGRRAHLECEVLIQPSFPGPHACTPPWVVDFYRELFPPPPAPPDARIYLPRRLDRAPRNEPAIAALLAAHGFEEVDPFDAPRLRERLARATHVVGTHGASLANLVFCRPGTRVLEIMPSEMAAHHNRLFYYTLCASGGLPYGVVLGRSPRQRLTPYSPQTKAPFDLDLPTFERALSALTQVESDVPSG